MDADRRDSALHVIESPSATTSADNTTGPLAYILAGIVIAAIVFWLVFTNTLSALMRQRFSASAESDFPRTVVKVEQLSASLKQPPDATLSQRPELVAPSTISLDEALRLDLAVAYVRIDDGIDAYGYARADASVADFVLTVSQLDASCSEAVDLLLRSAARDSDTARERIAEAQEEVAFYAEQIAALELPVPGGRVSEGAVAELARAQEQLEARYRFMNSELELLLQDGGIDFNGLVEADAGIRESTQEGTDALKAALELSKTR